MVKCPSCERAQEARLLCIGCGTPLGAEPDYFAAFELPRQLVIDGPALTGRYYELGRRVHPDRFANAPAAVRAASLKAAALLTRAYRALAEPVARGRYWLELHGKKLAAGNQQVPPELAAMVFEAQEAIAELRQTGDAAVGSRDAVRGHQDKVSAELDAARRNLDEVFASFDREPKERHAALFEALGRELAQIAYLQTLHRDLTKALDIRAAA